VSPRASVVHRVAAGENLTVIAEHYRVTVAAIVAANKISNPSYLRVGQQLTIPATGATRDASEPSFSTSMPSSLRALVAQRDDIRRLLSAEARAQGVPVAFVYAIAWQESGWQQRVVSSFGAIGVMQLTPATTDWIGGSLLGQRFDPRDAAQNIRAGVALLRHYLDRYHGDRSLVLAAYYQGQRAADLHGVYAVTRPYIESIKALVALFGG
jgi:soluble lytic murein transglycosylase-like protein